MFNPGLGCSEIFPNITEHLWVHLIEQARRPPPDTTETPEPCLNQCGHIRHRVKRIPEQVQIQNEDTRLLDYANRHNTITISAASPNNEADENNAGAIRKQDEDERDMENVIISQKQQNSLSYKTAKISSTLPPLFCINVHLQSSNDETSHLEQKRTNQFKKNRPSFSPSVMTT